MQIKFIESFLVLYQELNISKAAKRLFLTQQGLSRQIQSLEKEINTSLFIRSKNGVKPTEICSKLYPYYNNIYNSYMDSLALLEDYNSSKSSTLSIGFAIGLSNATDSSFLNEFQHSHPNINVNIFEFPKDVCIEKLKNRELDMAFLVNPFDMTPFESFPLAQGLMYAAIHKSNPLSSYPEPLSFSYLDRKKIITGSPQNSLRELFDYFCKLEGINPYITISSSYSMGIINNMHEDKGIGTLTSKMASLITNPDIIIKELETPVPGYMYCSILKQKSYSEQIKSLINYLKDRFSVK